MQTAAKEKTFLLFFAIASALLLCAPSFASSIDVSTGKTRAELFLLEGQNRTGQQTFHSAKHVGNYDPSWGVASESLVAPNRVLPGAGPIPRSLGAMSQAEKLARKFKLNVHSPTTQQVLNSLGDSVSTFVGKYRQGKILKELPGEVLDMSIEDALSHSSKVRKLLIDGRFVK